MKSYQLYSTIFLGSFTNIQTAKHYLFNSNNNKNRMVANDLKNALQEFLKTPSFNIEVLRFISCQQQPISSIMKSFQSRKQMIKTQFLFTFCFPHVTNRYQNLLSWKTFLYVSGPSLLKRAFLCIQFKGQGGELKLLFKILARSA